jgi:hypothetical protein
VRNAILIIGLLIGGLLAGAMLVDEGELVTVRTQGSNGAHYDTQLWVIDRDGELYLRAHFPGAKWLTRLRNHPEVEIQRGDGHYSALAVPVEDPEVRRAVNQAMSAKYGFADRLASAVWDPGKSIPVHLDRNRAPGQHP